VPEHNNNDDVDPAIEAIIRRLTDHLDARIDALKAELKEELRAELAGHFDARHDELCRRMTLVEERFDAGMDLFSRWADGIQRNTAYTRMLAEAAFAKGRKCPPEPATPQPGEPRPPEVDRAVNADPAEGVQRVDLPDYGAVLHLAPGADAEEAWQAARDAIRAGRRR
jgi:hypothetical protein